MSVDELRAIAAELSVSSAALDAALREHERSIALAEPTEGLRKALLVSALGLPLGAVAGYALSTAPFFTAAPVLSAVTASGLLCSAALVILHSRRPSLRSFIGHNGALWGGVIAGGLASIAVIGSVSTTDLPWLIILGSGVRSLLGSTVLGSAAIVAIRRAHRGARSRTEPPRIASGEGERKNTRSLRERVPAWLNVWRLIGHHGWRLTRMHQRDV
jgi:hypothetical protein